MPYTLASGLVSRLMPSLSAAADHEAGRFSIRLVLALLVAAVAMVALVVFAASAYLWLATIMEPPGAAAVTGCGLAVVAGLVMMISRIVGRDHSKARVICASAGGPAAGSSVLEDLMASVVVAIDRDARSQTPCFALVAVLAGCAVGASPRLRRAIAELAKCSELPPGE